MTDFKQLKDIANRLRINSIKATNAPNSGHPTSCDSMAEILSVLFFSAMNYWDPKDAYDRLILSNGHDVQVLYAAWAEAGLFPVEDLLNLRKTDSDFEGHPKLQLNTLNVGSGVHGEGIRFAAFAAFHGKNMEEADYNVFCVLGDGESAEGSVWEALSFASVHKLDNMFAIFNVDRQDQSEPAALGHQMDVYEAKCKAFGMDTYNIDGHSVEALVLALSQAKARKNGKPKAIICSPLEGESFPEIEDAEKWHGKPLGAAGEKIIAHLQSLLSSPETTLKPKARALDTQEPELAVQLPFTRRQFASKRRISSSSSSSDDEYILKKKSSLRD